MSIRGKGDYRKRIVSYVPPKLATMAERLARQRMSNLSDLVRSLLFDLVVNAVVSGELLNAQSQTNGIKGGSTGQQMKIDELLAKLEGGKLEWSDPQVQAWLEQNGYTLQKQVSEQGLALSSLENALS